MRVTFTDDAWANYCSWSDDRKMLARVNRLIGEALREPGVGIGKPEPLDQNLSGYWSRRITDEHRLAPAETWRRTNPRRDHLPHCLNA